MNPGYPAGYSAEAVPLHGKRHDMLPGQPEAPTVVQYTTVNMITEHPKDHIIWSLLCFVYGNPLCLGLAALIFSIKARDRKMLGDLDGAQHYGSTARCLNIVATILVVLFIVIFIIVFSVRTAQTMSYASNFPPYNWNQRG